MDDQNVGMEKEAIAVEQPVETAVAQEPPKQPAVVISSVEEVEPEPIIDPKDVIGGFVQFERLDSSRSLDIGIIGVGGAGCAIANEYAKRGYTAIAINTTKLDYQHLKAIPEDCKLEAIIGAGGAGKDPKVGKRAVNEYAADILKLVQTKLNNKEFVYVACGLGGGTGSLGGLEVARIAQGIDKPVGMQVTLPRPNEGSDEKVNALTGLQAIVNEKSLNSIVVTDLKRVALMLSDVPSNQFLPRADELIVEVFDHINKISSQPSGTAFDAEDYKKCLLTQGCLTLGSIQMDVEGLNNEQLIEKTKASITASMFATGFDYQTTIRAAGLLVKPEGKDFPASTMEAFYSAIKQQIGAGSVNRGIYSLPVSKLTVITLLAGMKLPTGRVQELSTEARQEAEDMGRKINERASEVVDLGAPIGDDLVTVKNKKNKVEEGSGVDSVLKRRK